VRHEFRKRNDLIPYFRGIRDAVDDLARAKPEELCFEVFTHGETILPYGLAVKPNSLRRSDRPSDLVFRFGFLEPMRILLMQSSEVDSAGGVEPE
jgi:hypothetical protein